MAEKEEIILIARSTDYTLTDTDKGARFDGKIAPHCANVFTRQEAIERMARAAKKAYRGYFYAEPHHPNVSDMMEAALNALLSKVE